MLSLCYMLLLNLVPLILISAEFNDKQSKFRGPLRVVGGRDALPGEFPYVLSMGFSVLLPNNTKIYETYCSCACLKPTWTLTAAHCIESPSSLEIPETAESVIRYHKIPNEVGYAKILSMFINPNYVSLSNFWLNNDVGLLKTEFIDISTYGKLSAVDYTTLYGYQIFAVGYGLTEDDEGRMKVPLSINKTLQVVNAVIIKCKENIHPVFCLTGVCGRWSALCPGDSGAPVIHSSGIVGVNSASSMNECERRQNSKPENTLETSVGMITPISPFVNWIINVIKLNE
ncbi:plasma kallikrein-like [Danaus plexippus]|uniref:plasma kallikrein-like n=1 Tax=Danaus plexippus TaxID=13037 RepID=UPI002AB1DA46|nr:plasma kallikrein-like [Danaus plexippus]